MKKMWIIGLAAVALFALSVYNGIVGADERCKEAWGNVETAYQRRADLIGNLVETVKGYKDYERETLEAVVQARSRATAVTVDPANLTPEKLREFQEAQGELGATFGRLLALTENYPDLKANESFKGLQDELAGTENRIAKRRTDFNEAVKAYNMKIRKLPGAWFAGFMGMETRVAFEAAAGAEKAPEVKF